MTKLKDLKKMLLKDPAVRKEYDALEEEFALMLEIASAKARTRAGLSQAELARRMKTTQSTIARLESGRGLPSTRTLGRFAKATGHRLKISFEPVNRRAAKAHSAVPAKEPPKSHAGTLRFARPTAFYAFSKSDVTRASTSSRAKH